jgi:hypothetical protein
MSVPTNAFGPDLVVTSDDGAELALVVEAKLHPTHLCETESQLKEYMLAMSCPVGLLVTPKEIRLYHDRYVSTAEDSVELVGAYAAPTEWAPWQAQADSSLADSAFDDVVREWLEGLASESGLRSLPPNFRQPAEEYLLPAIHLGAVRAARPRNA